MTVGQDNKTDVGDGTRGRPPETGRINEMQQRNGKSERNKRNEKGGKCERSRRRGQLLTAGVAVAWICTGLCLIQLARIRVQLKEQRELLDRTCNMVQLLRMDGADRMESQRVVSGSVPENGSGLADIAVETATVGVDTLTLSYAERCGLDYVDRPVERDSRQVLERLAELGKEDERIAAICINSEAYPERLLEALANNPEMADFVEGWTETVRDEAAELTESEKQEDFPLFLQWDPRWGYASYGSTCIALSGCGPTCLSMVLYYLTGDESLTPDVIGDYSMENGYYLPGTGTLWALLEETAPLYGIAVSQPEASEWEMKEALDGGGVLICSMRPGDFTVGGHFVVIYGYDEEGFLLNDPNCVARSRQSWSYERLCRQIKHLWVFEK